MLVQLLTDGENTKRGFNASFNFNPINKNCTNWLTSDKLVSPNYPKINCSWLVTASMNSIIYIEFENFQVNCHSFTSITWLKSQNSHNKSHYYIMVLSKAVYSLLKTLWSLPKISHAQNCIPQNHIAQGLLSVSYTYSLKMGRLS